MCVCVCEREIERNVNGERVYYCLKTACFSKNACKGVCVCVCVCVCTCGSRRVFMRDGKKRFFFLVPEGIFKCITSKAKYLSDFLLKKEITCDLHN